MAKKGGKSKGVMSKGMYSSVSKKITNAVRTDYLDTSDRIMNQLMASTVAWGTAKADGFMMK